MCAQALRAARVAHAIPTQAHLASRLLGAAVSTLRTLEGEGAISASDAAEAGGQLGVAIATLDRSNSAVALPLLQREWGSFPEQRARRLPLISVGAVGTAE